MKLHNTSSEIFVPDDKPVAEALDRITHLGIGAHQDDLELMAFHGIIACYAKEDLWFGGVTCTNGGGSSPSAKFATDAVPLLVETLREMGAVSSRLVWKMAGGAQVLSVPGLNGRMLIGERP